MSYTILMFTLSFCVILLGLYCIYLMWKLQKLTERVNELSYNLTALAERTCLIAKGLNELREDYIKRGGHR